MRRAGMHLPRRSAASVTEALSDTRVVVLTGARQVGKSTLAEMVLRAFPGSAARFLDDPGTRSAAAHDPVRFVRHDGLLLIDEVQRVPDLWLAIKETIYLVRRIPAWSANATARAVATPKLTFVDPGIAAHLASGAMSTQPEGALLENFVLSELGKQLSWADTSARLYHYRDRDGVEVDAVLEDNAGAVVGVDVKASETVRAEDFRGLRLLRDRLGDRFRAGFVLYCGEDSFSFGDRLGCRPISALWTA